MPDVTSPALSLFGGYSILAIIGCIMYTINIFRSHNFFSWGVPVKIMQTTITDTTDFYIILIIFFVHQIINTWVGDSYYPWLINRVQNKECYDTGYSKKITLIMTGAGTLYEMIDTFVIVSASSQISFFVVIVLAQLIVTTYVNWRYMNAKHSGYGRIL